MNIIYIITDTIKGLKYIGSKKDWKGNNTYFGSPSIKSIGHPKYKLQQQWKVDIKERPLTFMFEVLEEVINEKYLNERELEYQIKNDAINSLEFINGAYARKNFHGRCKGFKQDPDRIKELKELGTWKTTEEQKNRIRIAQTGKKYSDEINKKKGRAGEENPNARKVIIDDKIYGSVNSAAAELKVDRHTIINRIKNKENYKYFVSEQN